MSKVVASIVRWQISLSLYKPTLGVKSSIVSLAVNPKLPQFDVTRPGDSSDGIDMEYICSGAISTGKSETRKSSN